MKVLFLDFDGVLNSEASFRMEARRKNNRVSDTLSAVACANLQYILEQDRDVKLVISSTWRKLHTLVELQNILNSYGVEAARVIGKTPAVFSGHRGQEITLWLEENTNVTKFAVVDDDRDVQLLTSLNGFVVQTSNEDGLLLSHAKDIAQFFRGESV